MSVEGLNSVIANLNSKLNGIERQSKAGLYASGLIVQRLSQQRTPVDKGNLRASAYTLRLNNGETVEIGYTAVYAPFVHENLEQKLKGQPRMGGHGVYWETGGPKFLESALHDSESEILRTIQAYAERETR